MLCRDWRGKLTYPAFGIFSGSPFSFLLVFFLPNKYFLYLIQYEEKAFVVYTDQQSTPSLDLYFDGAFSPFSFRHRLLEYSYQYRGQGLREETKSSVRRIRNRNTSSDMVDIFSPLFLSLVRIIRQLLLSYHM